MSKIEKFISEVLAQADAQGCAKAGGGVFVQTAEDLTAEQAGWADEDLSRHKNFSIYKYWITTDDGSDPIGFDDASDDAVKFIGQSA